MAAKKGDDIWLTLASCVVVFAVVVWWVSDDEPDTPSTSYTVPKIVRTVDVNGIQFKIDAHDTNLNIKDDDALAQLIGLIRLHGYRCDILNAARPFILVGRGFVLDCNGFHYRYSIEDRGGKWTVTLD